MSPFTGATGNTHAWAVERLSESHSAQFQLVQRGWPGQTGRTAPRMPLLWGPSGDVCTRGWERRVRGTMGTVRGSGAAARLGSCPPARTWGVFPFPCAFLKGPDVPHSSPDVFCSFWVVTLQVGSSEPLPPTGPAGCSGTQRGRLMDSGHRSPPPSRQGWLPPSEWASGLSCASRTATALPAPAPGGTVGQTPAAMDCKVDISFPPTARLIMVPQLHAPATMPCHDSDAWLLMDPTNVVP